MLSVVDKVMQAIHRQGLVEIEVSAKHVHLSERDFKILFGENEEIKAKRPLSQPGQYLSEQRLSIIGPKGRMDRIALLGPYRKQTQVELSKSDCVALGVDAPLRESGDLEGSASIKIEGPKATIEIKEGAIIAHNHIHVTEADSKLLDLKNGDRVKVEVISERPITFDDVIIRVSKDFSCKMHIDFDEANAAFVKGFTLGKIIKKS